MSYLAKLGDYVFELDTAAFQSLQRQTAYRWEIKNRLKRTPAAQFIGRGEDTITLPGFILPHFRGGIGQVGRMREMADTGDPLPLVYAFERVGQYNGLWCIKDISETRTLFFRDGVPRRIDFQLTLVAYGEDAQGEGGGLTGGSALGALSSFGGSLSSLQAAANSLPVITTSSPFSLVNQVGDFVSNVAGMVGTAAQVATDTVRGAMGELVAAIPPEAIQAVRDVQQAYQYVQQVKGEVKAAIEVGRNIPIAIKTTAEDLQRQMTDVLPSIDTAANRLTTAQRSTLAVARGTTGDTQASWERQAAGIKKLENAAVNFRASVDEAATYAARAVESINV